MYAESAPAGTYGARAAVLEGRVVCGVCGEPCLYAPAAPAAPAVYRCRSPGDPAHRLAAREGQQSPYVPSALLA
ncbi:hypothetical protein ABZW32_32265, partial [Streptomyces sp. NPDC004667]|uniref:hypothetical protein n=1 Tax=Streptomyces sp. NPDC004667 TaxID=3154285 RepID=UPI0033A2BEBE